MRIDLTNGAICHGDSLEVLKTFPDNSIDSVVTDPPYGLSFMGKKWDYDVPAVELWKEVLRVLKPGGHALIACGTRTQHRMVCNIEDAGFEIRDVVSWVYSSGFPKSLNIGKAIDQIQGNERVHLGVINKLQSYGLESNNCYGGDIDRKGKMEITRGTSPYEGWGTALKPAVEFFTLVRKPISEKNIAENVLKWGTGGINIDGCRVEIPEGDTSGYWEQIKQGNAPNGIKALSKIVYEQGARPRIYDSEPPKDIPTGRFPANFIHDGSDEVTELFLETSAPGGYPKGTFVKDSNCYGKYNGITREEGFTFDKGGSAARFFYCAKASPSERNEGLEGMEERITKVTNMYEMVREDGTMRQLATKQNHHPTVKPLALMQYLIRLITPPGGTVLDPFAGSGTTGIAAINEGFRYLLIEREEDYIPIITARLNHWEKKKDHEPGDLFEEVI